MNDCEAKLVRRRLDDYQQYKVLAEYADRASIMMQIKIDNAGFPSGGSSGIPNQNPTELSSVVNALISDQMEYDRQAADYRKRASAIKEFIVCNLAGETREIFLSHFCEGDTYEDMEPMYNRTASGLRKITERALYGIDFCKARDILNLSS